MIRPLLAGVLAALAILLFAYGMLVASIPARAGEVQCGRASWYGAAHHGRLTASGQPFDMNAYTAAMWGPAFGTRYRVTRGDRSVVVTITDRGPAKRLNRIIDLSKAAAGKLGMIEAGVADVCLQRL